MDFDTIFNNILKLHEYLIEIGVISGNTKRKDTYKLGLTNAEIMFINENGSPLRHIPARPVLQMTIAWANQNLLNPTIDRCIEKYINSGFNEEEVEKELNRMCMRMENYARQIIYSNDGRLAPNAPSVAKAKGGNHPLFDTGQLVRSITCKLIKL